MENAQLIALINGTNENLSSLLLRFKHRQNEKQTSARWSAADLAEHLLMLRKRIVMILLSEGKKTDRKADEKLDVIKSSMEDLSTKRTAPAFITPSAGDKEITALVDALHAEKNEMIELVQHVDMKELATAFPHRIFGELTRLEWIGFEVYHTQRHLKQLQQMADMLSI